MSFLFNIVIKKDKNKSLFLFVVIFAVLIGNIFVECLSIIKQENSDEIKDSKNKPPQSLNQNDYVFDLADITVDYEDKLRNRKLEAFRIKENDNILRENNTKRYKELKWVSIG